MQPRSLGQIQGLEDLANALTQMAEVDANTYLLAVLIAGRRVGVVTGEDLEIYGMTTIDPDTAAIQSLRMFLTLTHRTALWLDKVLEEAADLLEEP